MRELVARVRVLFRRAALARQPDPTADSRLLRLGALALDFDRYLARWKDRPVALTVTEFLLLHALARHPGHVKTRKQLLEQGYPHDAYVSERTIDCHVKRLRAKFVELDPAFDGDRHGVRPRATAIARRRSELARARSARGSPSGCSRSTSCWSSCRRRECSTSRSTSASC